MAACRSKSADWPMSREEKTRRLIENFSENLEFEQKSRAEIEKETQKLCRKNGELQKDLARWKSGRTDRDSTARASTEAFDAEKEHEDSKDEASSIGEEIRNIRIQLVALDDVIDCYRQNQESSAKIKEELADRKRLARELDLLEKIDRMEKTLRKNREIASTTGLKLRGHNAKYEETLANYRRELEHLRAEVQSDGDEGPPNCTDEEDNVRARTRSRSDGSSPSERKRRPRRPSLRRDASEKRLVNGREPSVTWSEKIEDDQSAGPPRTPRHSRGGKNKAQPREQVKPRVSDLPTDCPTDQEEQDSEQEELEPRNRNSGSAETQQAPLQESTSRHRSRSEPAEPARAALEQGLLSRIAAPLAELGNDMNPLTWSLWGFGARAAAN